LGTINLSLGLAEYKPGEPLEVLINRSDQALYLAQKTAATERLPSGISPDNTSINFQRKKSLNNSGIWCF
jgi:GGDEF domain-containing protein